MQNHKKILIVTEFFFPEEFKVNDLAFKWREKGYYVDVITLVPSYPLGEIFPGFKNRLFTREIYKGVKIYRLKTITGYKNSLFKKIAKYINFMILGGIVSIFIGRKYDYIFGFNASSLTSMMPAVIPNKIYSKPLTLWVQDLWPDSVYAYGFNKSKILSISLNLFIKFIYKNVSSIAISGKGFESKLKPYVNNNLKFNYLPNWADDLEEHPKKISFSERTLIHFTFAGNIGKVQNLENIIHAFSLLPKNLQNKAQLNIIGDGSNLENLRNLANRNLNIVFHGKKPREDMAKYYQASDFLIVSLIDKPIFSVTVPAKTQTYIAAKKPILAIINGETANIVTSNSLGIYANPSEINDILSAFKKCIEMTKVERDSFILNNKYLLENVFNKNKIIDDLLDLLIGKS